MYFTLFISSRQQNQPFLQTWSYWFWDVVSLDCPLQPCCVLSFTWQFKLILYNSEKPWIILNGYIFRPPISNLFQELIPGVWLSLVNQILWVKVREMPSWLKKKINEVWIAGLRKDANPGLWCSSKLLTRPDGTVISFYIATECWHWLWILHCRIIQYQFIFFGKLQNVYQTGGLRASQQDLSDVVWVPARYFTGSLLNCLIGFLISVLNFILVVCV